MALDKNLVETFEKMLDIKEENISEAVSVDGRSRSYREAVGRIKNRKNVYTTNSVMKDMDLDKDMEDAVKEMVHGGDDMDSIKGKIEKMMKDKTVSENKLNPSSDKNLPDAAKATIATSNADNRGNTVAADTAAHNQKSDSQGDDKSNKELKTNKSDASAEVASDKANHDQAKDDQGNTTSNATISNPGSPESTGDVEADKTAHKQDSDELDTMKTKVVVKEDDKDEDKKDLPPFMKKDKDSDEDNSDEDKDEVSEKKMKEDEIVIKTDGKSDDEKEAPMTDKQKDVDVDDDGDIEADDLKDLRSGKTDADIGIDDGADKDEDKSDDKKDLPPFMKKNKDEVSERKMKEDEIIIKTDSDSKEDPKGDSETLKANDGDSEAEVNKDKDSVEEDANDKELPASEKETHDTASKGDNESSTVEADKPSHDQATDKNAEASTGAGSKATSAEADKASHVQANDKQDDSTDETLPGKGAGAKGIEADKGSHDQAKDKITEADLNEDFKERAKVIFETAVNEKVNTIKEEITKEFATKLEEEKVSMETKLAEFTDYAVKEWLNENKLEVKYSLRTEIAEGFIGNLKKVFEDHYISIPEEDIDVVDELTESVESFKDQVEESGKTVETLKAELLGLRKDSIVSKLSEDLTDTQKLRLAELSESVEATDTDEFASKLAIVKESYFAGDDTNTSLISSLTEEVNTESADAVSSSGSVDFYANWLASTKKSNKF